MLMLTIMLALQDLPPIPLLEVKPVDGGYELTAGTFDGSLAAQIQAQASARAKEQCGAHNVEWGKFTYSTNLGKKPGESPPVIEGFRHAFRCVAPDTATYPAAPADWKASPADEADVRRIFAHYYARRDSGALDEAYALFEPETVADRNTWSAGIRDFNAKAGSGTRRIAAINWYVNPEQASHPGIFVAVDFIADFPRLDLYCGYVGFYRRAPGDYRIIREEQNSSAKADGSVDPAQLARIRASLCRGE